MKYYYDFHIHTALSPCGDEDMTPNNIVNMALLKELDMIAITDHNSCENVEAVMKVAQGTNLLVIPGMEIESSEEVHMICLFPSLEAAKAMQEIVYNSLPPLKNRTDIFGKQLILNEYDDVIGENDRLLLTATSLSVYDLVKEVERQRGVVYPAHIDRKSYSIISNLGWIPEDLGVKTIEISRYAEFDKYISEYSTFNLIQSSDAHYLQDISEREHFIELAEKSPAKVIEYLNKR